MFGLCQEWKGFCAGNGNNSDCQCGPALERRQRGITNKIRLIDIMKKILTLSIAVMAVSVLSAGAADAKANYEKSCAKCHGADGKGETKMGKKRSEERRVGKEW